MSDPSVPKAGETIPGVVLYDGVCGLCDRLVQWLLAHDPHKRLRFAPLQGEYAAALRQRFSEFPDDLDTMVFVEGPPGEERVYLRSAAAFRVARHLESPWRLFASLSFLPRWFTDFVYRAVARSRYRLFGRFDACRLPGEEERARFLL